MMKIALFTAYVTLAILMMEQVVSAQAIIYVNASSGNDQNKGTAAAPVLTLERARTLAREKNKKEQVTVVLTGNFIRNNATFSLDKNDSGKSAKEPMIYRASPKGANLLGGYVIKAENFKPVTNKDILARLLPNVQGKVLSCDLKSLGITALKESMPTRHGGYHGVEVFCNSQRMTLARWPNEGCTHVGKVIAAAKDKKSKAVFQVKDNVPINRWNVSNGIWMHGYWCHDWNSESVKIESLDLNKKQITTAGHLSYGLGSGSRRFYFFNLLEELDVPGEWYVDRATLTLYFYPPQEKWGSIFLTVSNHPMINIQKASNIRLEGISIRNCMNYAVAINNCSNVSAHKMKIFNVTHSAVSINGGNRCGISDSEIAYVGGTGISLNGGNRWNLTPCNHYITQCKIHHCGVYQRTAGKCVALNGVGCRIANSVLHNVPYIALNYSGNDHLIEGNEIYCAMMEGRDGGAVYTGRDWGSQGNIFRGNYVHHLAKAGWDWIKKENQNPPYMASAGDMIMGIYLDDCDSGDTVTGNVFHRAGYAVFIGGGRYNTVENNIMLACACAIHLDDRGLKRINWSNNRWDSWALEAKIKHLKYQQDPWKNKYPRLVNIMKNNPALPLENSIIHNVAINCTEWLHTNGSVEKTSVPKINFQENIIFGKTSARDRKNFPQNTEGKKRLIIQTSHHLENVTNPYTVQSSDEFKKLAPWFKQISRNPQKTPPSQP